MRCLLALTLLLLALGCSGSKPSTGDASSPEGVATAFGRAVMAEKWADAYAHTSADWRKKWTEEGTKSFYTVLKRDMEKSSGKPFRPSDVSVKELDLPRDPLDARERFGVTTEPPMKLWKAMLEVALLDKAGGAQATLPMLVIQEEGAYKVAFVAFKSGKSGP